jgi:hypothetical protein
MHDPDMLRLLVASLVVGCACAQSPQERVAAVLRDSDPLRNGKGAAELLGADPPLDAAIRATAASTDAEKVVRLRALRLSRALDLAQRVKEQRRDLAWWLAFDEIDREVHETVRPFLLTRASLDPKVIEAVRQQLTAANTTAQSFCREWNEIRFTGELAPAQRREQRHYDELEAALAKAGVAAVPALFHLMEVPPEIAFSVMHEEDGITGRQQVRALLGLATILKCKEALPYFMLHTGTPSITQSADAAGAIQQLTGEQFGAGFLQPGDHDAIEAWWKKHRAEHGVVLDHLVHHVVQWGLNDANRSEAQRRETMWCCGMRLGRLLGREEPPRDAGNEVLRAILEDAEREWLLERH